jgi:hypothetical protein
VSGRILQHLVMLTVGASLLAACQVPNKSQVELPRDEAERAQLVTILAQSINGPADPLDTRVAQWGDPIEIAVVGGSGSLQDRLFAQGIEPFMADFKTITGTPFRRVPEQEANVLVVIGEDVETLWHDFEPQMDRVLRDPRFTATFKVMAQERQGDCSVVALDDRYLYFGAVILTSRSETDPHFVDCVGPALASMVGLQGRPDEPGSIKFPGGYLRRPTELDRKALGILYGFDKPGDRLRDIPALQDSI